MTRRELAPLFLSPLLAAVPASPLNHFYTTVDPATYAAIEQSKFLQEEFAPFEKRTTVRNDGSYSGLYFYGSQTYFEFFEAGKGARQPGDIGVALGIETAGASSQLRGQWQSLQPSVVSNVTRQLDGKPVDWFDMTSFEGDTRERSIVPGFRMFAMEYKPHFLKQWNPAGPDAMGRRDILAGYCEKLGLTPIRQASLLDDVTILDIHGPPASLHLRSAQLAAAGWKRDRKRCWAPDIAIRMHPSPKQLGISRIEFRLKREAPPRRLRLGASTLELKPGRRAVWTLPPAL